ncbi:MAG: PqqD family protein, partial [Proteobacteria bacterium]|nr:PqqD family protein [Pseudomonadota bacterium]
INKRKGSGFFAFFLGQHVTKRDKGPSTVARAGHRRASLRFYGDEFVFDTVSGMFYRISPTASFILRSLDAGTAPDKLADEVQQRYHIDRAAAVRDIELLRNDFAAIESLSRGPA